MAAFWLGDEKSFRVGLFDLLLLLYKWKMKRCIVIFLINGIFSKILIWFVIMYDVYIAQMNGCSTSTLNRVKVRPFILLSGIIVFPTLQKLKKKLLLVVKILNASIKVLLLLWAMLFPSYKIEGLYIKPSYICMTNESYSLQWNIVFLIRKTLRRIKCLSTLAHLRLWQAAYLCSSPEWLLSGGSAGFPGRRCRLEEWRRLSCETCTEPTNFHL